MPSSNAWPPNTIVAAAVPLPIAQCLDDLAYGSDAWSGAFEGRLLRGLLPDIRWKEIGGYDTRTEGR
jgi:hypothetical protein